MYLILAAGKSNKTFKDNSLNHFINESMTQLHAYFVEGIIKVKATQISYVLVLTPLNPCHAE